MKRNIFLLLFVCLFSTSGFVFSMNQANRAHSCGQLELDGEEEGECEESENVERAFLESCRPDIRCYHLCLPVSEGVFIEGLSNLVALEILYLSSDLKLTDRCVEEGIASCKKLERLALFISENSITIDGLRALPKKLKILKINCMDEEHGDGLGFVTRGESSDLFVDAIISLSPTKIVIHKSWLQRDVFRAEDASGRLNHDQIERINAAGIGVVFHVNDWGDY